MTLISYFFGDDWPHLEIYTSDDYKDWTPEEQAASDNERKSAMHQLAYSETSPNPADDCNIDIPPEVYTAYISAKADLERQEEALAAEILKVIHGT